ncbi:hypothetical protein [Rhodococcus aetherivorans]|uniref:hypothetical protein n=1 Tax=Rhodococcus aetherivorans TaxID=191292 RepID=UPI00163AF75C|nr:hypothetical protein [Rhodococcus aetherivorans]MBC2592371.1 hypothetical protein [Rhodococcus aetherivorans]
MALLTDTRDDETVAQRLSTRPHPHPVPDTPRGQHGTPGPSETKSCPQDRGALVGEHDADRDARASFTVDALGHDVAELP